MQRPTADLSSDIQASTAGAVPVAVAGIGDLEVELAFAVPHDDAGGGRAGAIGMAIDDETTGRVGAVAFAGGAGLVGAALV